TIRLSLVHQARAPVLAAHRIVDPQVGDLQPTAPDRTQHAAERLAALALHEELDRIPGRHAGNADIVQVESFADVPGLGAGDIRIEYDREVAIRHRQPLVQERVSLTCDSPVTRV